MNNRKIYRGVGGIYRYQKLNHSSIRSWRLLFKPVCASTEIELTNWIKNEPIINNQQRAIFSSQQNIIEILNSRNERMEKYIDSLQSELLISKRVASDFTYEL